LDTADDSLELTEGRRTASEIVESDVVRDWEFMVPWPPFVVVYRHGICDPESESIYR
jgi:hypothetical protein